MTKTAEKPKPAGDKPAEKAEAKNKPAVTAQPATLKPDVPKPQPHPETSKTIDIPKEIDTLWQAVTQQAKLITELQETIAKKRRPPASSSKVKIKDTQTGKTYPSKNNAYQTLLRSGDLKDLVDKGVFGDVPEKNTFGWYALKREWPDRFEEIHEDKPNDDGKDKADDEQ